MSQEYEQQKIMQVDLEREMKKSYIDYAMSVIVGRALPQAVTPPHPVRYVRGRSDFGQALPQVGNDRR